jgi:iron-sulfur cluster assembly protein
MKFDCSTTALNKIKSLKPKQDSLLRVGIIGGGCNGFMYAFSWFDEKKPEDVCFVFDDLTIIIDKKSLKLLDGSTLDCGSGLNDRGLFVSNPNVSGACGCGKSIQF